MVYVESERVELKACLMQDLPQEVIQCVFSKL